MSTATEIEVTDEELGPEERFSIYERRYDGLHLIATCPSPASIGVALVTLAEDRWDADDVDTPILGVLDNERKRWVTGLWGGTMTIRMTLG